MKPLACVLFAFTALGLVGASLITEKQGMVCPAIEELKLEAVKSKVIGGPQRYKVTKATIDYLQKLMKEGKVIIVNNDGSITTEKESK
jgi:hypothetical protein